MLKRYRLIAFSLSALIITTVICSVFKNNVSADAFAERLTAPEKTNTYYYSDKNIFYKAGYGMPNCTCYAYGRAYEILKTKPKLSVDSAKYWYDYNIANNCYAYGLTPKLGAIACWSYESGGHVAVVEKITSTTITFSNSAWGGQEFYLTTANINDKNPGQTGWNFQGYIYIGDFVSNDNNNGESNIPTGKYRITSDNGVNLRDNAGTSYKIIGFVDYNEYVTVTKTLYADGYSWGYINHNGVNGWCVLDFAEYIASTDEPVEPPTEPPTEPSNSGNNKIGDANGDGKINIVDATLIQKYSLRIAVKTINLTVCDVNQDGKINIIDATLVQKYSLRIHIKYPIGEYA